MTALRSNAARRCSTANLSLPNVTSPRRVKGRTSPCVVSARPSSQAASSFGLSASISAGPVKLTPSPLTARCPLNFTCVKPGARNSKRSRFHPPASVLISPRRLATLLPPSVTWSMPMPIWIGIAGRKAPPANCAILRMAAAGGGRVPSAAASARSRSIWRPDSTPSKRGLLAELEIGDAGELDPLVLGPVLEFELLHQRRGCAGLDLAAQPPGLAHGLARCAAPCAAISTGRVRLACRRISAWRRLASACRQRRC